jgi:hypothetical protein
LVEHVHALDRALVDVGERIREVASNDDLSEVLDDAARLLDERFGAIADAPSPQ